MCFKGRGKGGYATRRLDHAISGRNRCKRFEAGRAYTFVQTTTNQRFATTDKDKVEDMNIPVGVNAVCELVINGIDAVAAATKAVIEAAVKVPGVKKITAGNYGGSLGQFKVNLSDLL